MSVTEAELIAGEAYQIIGSLSHYANMFDHPEVQRALDWFSGFEPGITYKDDASILPWPKEELKADPNIPRASGVPEAEAVAYATQEDLDNIKNGTAVAAGLLWPDAMKELRGDYVVPLYLAPPPVETTGILYAAPGGGYYSTRWEFEEAWREHKAKHASPPPVAAPSGEAIEEAFRSGWVAKSKHWNVHEALGSYLASLPSPIASEPKDAGSGEGQEMPENEQSWALADAIQDCTYNAAYLPVLDWVKTLNAAGYRITRTAPSGAKP